MDLSIQHKLHCTNISLPSIPSLLIATRQEFYPREGDVHIVFYLSFLLKANFLIKFLTRLLAGSVYSLLSLNTHY